MQNRAVRGFQTEILTFHSRLVRLISLCFHFNFTNNCSVYTSLVEICWSGLLIVVVSRLVNNLGLVADFVVRCGTTIGLVSIFIHDRLFRGTPHCSAYVCGIAKVIYKNYHFPVHIL